MDRRRKKSACAHLRLVAADGAYRRYAQAVAPLLATAFTTLLTTTFKLLHCVDIENESRVFRAAGVAWPSDGLFCIG